MAEGSRSPAERLVQIEQAIETIETKGQRYTIKDRELWRADLKTLYAERDRLRAQVNRSGRRRVRRIL